MTLTSDDIIQIGDVMVKALEPVYEDLDELKKDMKGVKKTLAEHTKILDEHTDKIDALTLDMIELQDDVKIIKDQSTGIGEELQFHKKDIQKIKRHVGLPLN